MRACQRAVIPILGALLAAAAGALAADWPQWRGPQRDNIARETGLLRKWPAGGPKVLWSTEVCQGYAAAVIHSGRVYFEDYDREKKEWLLRCLALADGRELWRFAEAKTIRPNHGITRTSPAVDERFVFALDPKCVFHCLDAATGKEIWRKDLVEVYGTQVPPWYNGQNPLIEPDRVVLGVGGAAVLVALDKPTGDERWRTPNPAGWLLSHASVMPAELCGVKQYLWCTLAGPVGVAADDGRLLWHHDRKFNVAVAPSPLAVGDDRVFMTSGYDAGTVMLRVRRDGERFSTETLFDWTAEKWSAEVHTPVLHDGHLLAVGKEQRGLLTCLRPDGEIVWTSAGRAEFDLGSFLLADGLLFILEGKTGVLRLVEANVQEYRELDHAAVLHGDSVWGPMALAGGRLVLRDMRRMVCVQVGAEKAANADEPPVAGAVPRSPPDSAAAPLARNDQAEALAGEDSSDAGPAVVLVRHAVCQRVPVASPVTYRLVQTFDVKGAGPGRFVEARGLAVGPHNRLYLAGDGKIAVYSPELEFIGETATSGPVWSVGVAADGTVYAGAEGRVEVFTAGLSASPATGPARTPSAGPAPAATAATVWEDGERLGRVTAIAAAGERVFLADVQGRCVREYERSGKMRTEIGKANRMRGFLIPNGFLDFALDPRGELHVANPGMHRVERYSDAGALLGRWGRFDGQDPAGFTGCCNPTNIALAPDGDVLVSEKAPPRIKCYTSAGELRAVFGADELDPTSRNVDLAVDDRGRVFALDTARVRILVWEPLAPAVKGEQQ